MGLEEILKQVEIFLDKDGICNYKHIHDAYGETDIDNHILESCKNYP